MPWKGRVNEKGVSSNIEKSNYWDLNQKSLFFVMIVKNIFISIYSSQGAIHVKKTLIFDASALLENFTTLFFSYILLLLNWYEYQGMKVYFILQN